MSASPTADQARATTVARRRRPTHRRRPVRPLGDGTTERVRLIEFLWPAGTGIQPVLMLDRRLLD